jgi:C_GCAxxG_C_C family probable redox protein
MASGFGGGIGGSGATCGALVGAVMAVGLVKGRDSTDGDRAAAGAISRRIHDAFEEEMGSTACRELTGLDLTTSEGAKQFGSGDVPAQVCRPAVELAERLALEELRSATN